MMFENTFLFRRALLASVLGLALPAAALAQCPTADLTARKLQDVFKRPIEVKKVSPAALKGLCELQVSFQGQPSVLYTDTLGAYFIIGPLIETATSRNLTEETLSVLKSLSPEELKKVDSLVALSVGSKGPKVYFVTDPL